MNHSSTFRLSSDIIESSRCVLCGNSRARILREVPARKNVYYHLRCTQCGLIYGHPIDRLSIQERDVFNTQTWEAHKFNRGKFLQELEAFRDTFRRQLSAIEKYCGKGPLLEVGPGLGLFLKVASEEGWESCGVDVSGEAAAFVTDVVGVPCYHGMIESIHLPHDHFHAVRLRHVLEHQEDPFEFLRHIFCLLTSGGMVLIDVPNALGTYYTLKTLLSPLSGKKTRYLPLSLPGEHLFAFTPSTLRVMVEKAGFKVLRLKTVCLREKSYFPIRRFSTWRELHLHLCDRLGKPINLGSIIMLCAQKKA